MSKKKCPCCGYKSLIKQRSMGGKKGYLCLHCDTYTLKKELKRVRETPGIMAVKLPHVDAQYEPGKRALIGEYVNREFAAEEQISLYETLGIRHPKYVTVEDRLYDGVRPLFQELLDESETGDYIFITDPAMIGGDLASVKQVLSEAREKGVSVILCQNLSGAYSRYELNDTILDKTFHTLEAWTQHEAELDVMTENLMKEVHADIQNTQKKEAKPRQKRQRKQQNGSQPSKTYGAEELKNLLLTHSYKEVTDMTGLSYYRIKTIVDGNGKERGRK